MTKKICNICGKELNVRDICSNTGFHQKIGYGSKYDDLDIDLDMCCRCFDLLIDHIVSMCKYNPILGENGD